MTDGPDRTDGERPADVRLWLVRHGETAWARVGRHTGRTDLPLTPHGEEQAAALAPRLAGVPFAAVRCSPLQRARRTLELALPDRSPVLDDDLAERDYGSAEGRTRAELRQADPTWDSWRTPVPGAETIAQVGDRADRAIAAALRDAGPVPPAPPAREAGGPRPGPAVSDVPAEAGGLRGVGDPAGRDVLLVAHGHLLRILAARWLGQPATFGEHLPLAVAALSVLGTDRGRPVLLRWNDAR
ncbi:histidine phosphatase family protein [Patulibacter brassicae]|uniref:Histidine phosphatase family protein n=1 Tax=Patulibacter brassicae TaxID=1705717 RepID=A0ABU4VHR3_9ACTN|nr:histidine phosphatase family protein [Patulibacter brassicae]MDX8151361.1 histidine phosphatase family protein [Patulibacter brassicae]